MDSYLVALIMKERRPRHPEPDLGDDPALETERNWLRARQAQMQATLESLGLPPRAWEAVLLLPMRMEDFADCHEARFLLDRGVLLKWLLVEQDSRSRSTAYFSSAVARVCDALLNGPRTNPWAAGTAANREVLWRLLERCENLRRLPEQGTQALKQMLSAGAKGARRTERLRAAPVHAAVREEFERLRAKGLSRATAARVVHTNAEIRSRIIEVARKNGDAPWRRDFYSIGAIRKIADA